MTEIVSVRVGDNGKRASGSEGYATGSTGDYSVSGLPVKPAVGDYVVVPLQKEIECGRVVAVHNGLPGKIYRSVTRVATERDLRTMENNRRKEAEMWDVFCDKIRTHNLAMKPISVECSFEGGRAVYYFTSESRVDFRELVKDLAAMFKRRIELRQVGVRDEARILGGFGICGREFCCKTFLTGFQPVSIKMAKEQSLSLNPAKTSGTCGRLMCCLKYEQSTYELLMKNTPLQGSVVEIIEADPTQMSVTKGMRGTVEDANILTSVLKVRFDGKPAAVSVKAANVKTVRGSHIKLSGNEIAALKGLED
ncbi:signal peptidase II [Clostridia bacterium]|nr:signal peptidase II [Clostridia bacterium]